MLKQADWKTAHTIMTDSGKVFEIVLLNSNSTFDDPAKTLQRYLVVLKQNNNITTNIYEIFGNVFDITGKEDICIKNFNQSVMPNFSGEVTFYKWNSQLIESKVYENGINTLNKILTTNPLKSKKIQSTDKRLNQCIDWYWEYYDSYGNNTGEQFAYTTCSSSCDQQGYRDPNGILKVKTNCDAGGPTNNPPSSQSQDTVMKLKDTTCANMTAQEITTINNTLNQLQSVDCAIKFVYHNLIDNHKSFYFCISNSGVGNGEYDPASRTITFSTDYAATNVYVLEHEVIHTYQDLVYPGGIQQYGRTGQNGLKKTGFVNLEFEQLVYSDIVHGTYEAFEGDSFQGTPEQLSDYKDFINNYTNKNSSFDQLRSGTEEYNEFLDDFNTQLQQFKSIPNNPYNSNIANLKPQALINIFNHALLTGC